MRISELSRLSGTSVPTIKYYVREGLLASGERLNETQSDYTTGHLHRLRLIRALVDVGKMPISSVQTVLAALDDPQLPIGATFDLAQRALAPQAPSEGNEPSEESVARVDALVKRMGWSHSDTSVGRVIVARVIETFARLDQPLSDAYLDVYARAAAQVAGADLDEVALVADRSNSTELVVIGTVLGDTLAAGLRRIAHAHATAERGMLS